MRELAGGEPATTNNRMELQAAISALAALKESCEITLFIDSECLRQGITEWLPRWRANNWRTVGPEVERGQRHDPLPVLGEPRNQSRADESTRTGNKNVHYSLSRAR
jgi:hypothetical protein